MTQNLIINTLYLTPSSQEIKDNKGKVTFEGRTFTYFSRLGTTLLRQVQKILRFCHLIKWTELNNKDALDTTTKYIATIQSKLKTDDLVTIKQNIQSIKNQIALVKRCISNKKEMEIADALLVKCADFDTSIATREEKLKQIVQRANQAAANAETHAASAEKSAKDAQDILKQAENLRLIIDNLAAIRIQRWVREYRKPIILKKSIAAIKIQRWVRECLSKKGHHSQPLSNFALFRREAKNVIKRLPKKFLLKAFKEVAPKELKKVIKGAATGYAVFGVLQQVKTAVKELYNGRPATALVGAFNIAGRALLHIGPVIDPNLAAAKQQAKAEKGLGLNY